MRRSSALYSAKSSNPETSRAPSKNACRPEAQPSGRACARLLRDVTFKLRREYLSHSAQARFGEREVPLAGLFGVRRSDWHRSDPAEGFEHQRRPAHRRT